MLSVVIPTLNAEAHLPDTLSCLVGPTARGLVRQVIVADGGSGDATRNIADAAGADIVVCEKGRGTQLAKGATAAKCDWLLFLHADTVLDGDWEHEVRQFVARMEGQGEDKAAVFRFAVDAYGTRARRLEWMVRLRNWLLALPYGDQGLLISRHLYTNVGGFEDLPLLEDVSLIRRIGRRRLVFLRSRAVTSANRFVKGGFVMRPLKNLTILALYYLRVPPHVLVRFYE